MRRLCERPGCGASAEVSYGIDNATLTVWVDNRAVHDREHAGRLCRRHADALVVPRGWTIDDRRQPIPQLFRTTDSSAPAPAVRTSPARKSSRTRHEDGPSLFETIQAELDEQSGVSDTSDAEETDLNDSPTDVHIDPDETQAIPWSPHLRSDGSGEESDDEQPVFGRLLGRAFGKKQQ